MVSILAYITQSVASVITVKSTAALLHKLCYCHNHKCHEMSMCQNNILALLLIYFLPYKNHDLPDFKLNTFLTRDLRLRLRSFPLAQSLKVN